jgi:hypothetical protein
MASSDDFVILTEKGLAFVKEWFGVAKRVPSDLTKEFQMLVHIGSYGGVMNYELLKEIGYADSVVKRALNEGFIIISKETSRLENNVKLEIARMVGKPPESLYV